MTKYYHLASKDNVESILDKGLEPKADYRVLPIVQTNPDMLQQLIRSHFLLDALLQPFNYFWHEPKLRQEIQASDVQLEVEIPDAVRMERDYNQFITMYLSFLASPKRDLQKINQALKMYDVELETSLEGNMKADIKAIREAVDRIPKKTWDGNCGAYRTEIHVLADSIKVLS